jgi:hypothetical protein
MIILLYCKIHKITILLNIARFEMALKSEDGKDIAGEVFTDTAVCSAVGSEFVYFT